MDLLLKMRLKFKKSIYRKNGECVMWIWQKSKGDQD